MTGPPHERRPGEAPHAARAPQPFYTAAVPGLEAPRLLLLTYHFPPSSETGALRWEAMVHYASEWGWEVDVVTRDPGALDPKSLERLRQLPAGCRVFGAEERSTVLERTEGVVGGIVRRLKRGVRGNPAPAPVGGEGGTPPAAGAPPVLAYRAEDVYRLPLSIRQCFRAYFAWREFVIQGPWSSAAVHVADKLAQELRYEALITCGPPHLIHAATASLSERAGLPLVLDLRDPWSLQQILPDFRASKLWYRLASRHEARAVRQAAVIALNTEPCRDAMRAKYPEKARRMIAVTNGYDEREQIPESVPDGRFLITYAGSLYFVYEHPLPFFQGVAALVREFGLTPGQLGLEFVGHSGNYEGESMESIAASAGLADYFRSLPHQPRREVLPRLSRASVLVSLAQFNDFAIPSKIFDYLRFDAWLLAVAKPGSATDILLHGTDADLVPSNDSRLIHLALRKRYLQFAEGVKPRALAPQTRSSRREQAALFFQAVREATGPRPPG